MLSFLYLGFFFFFRIVIFNTQIQSNKQDIGQMQKKIKLNINELRSTPEPSPKITSRWTNEEVMLAIQGKIY